MTRNFLSILYALLNLILMITLGIIRYYLYANSIDQIKIFEQAIQSGNAIPTKFSEFRTFFLTILLDHVILSLTYVMSIHL